MKELIAKDLLKIKAVFFRPEEPFTWASGIKSPVYCDNRLTLSDVAVRNDVENGLAQLVKENYPDAEVLFRNLLQSDFRRVPFPARHKLPSVQYVPN